VTRTQNAPRCMLIGAALLQDTEMGIGRNAGGQFEESRVIRRREIPGKTENGKDKNGV